MYPIHPLLSIHIIRHSSSKILALPKQQPMETTNLDRLGLISSQGKSCLIPLSLSLPSPPSPHQLALGTNSLPSRVMSCPWEGGREAKRGHPGVQHVSSFHTLPYPPDEREKGRGTDMDMMDHHSLPLPLPSSFSFRHMDPQCGTQRDPPTLSSCAALLNEKEIWPCHTSIPPFLPAYLHFLTHLNNQCPGYLVVRGPR